jgi:hypothetical protein
MRDLVNRRRAAWLILGLACALPAAADDAGPETQRWIPALAVLDVVVAQQTETTAENEIRPSLSDDDRLLLAVVAAEGLITPTPPEDETAHAIPHEAIVDGAILQNASGDVVVAIPVVVAAADGGMPAATSAPAVTPTADDATPSIAVAREVASGGAVEPGAPGQVRSPPQAVGAQPAPRDETERWVPSFSVYSGVLVQSADGQLVSSRILGECADPPPGQIPPDPAHCQQQIRPTAPPSDVPLPSVTISGDDLMVTPFVGGSLELMTPGLTSLPGRPRLFVHGDAAASFSATRDLAKEGVPDAFAVAEDLRDEDFLKESTILGQGSTTSAELRPLVISAGAGVAFTLEAWERRIRIKPSVEYLREEIEVKGVVHRAVQTRYVPAPKAGDFLPDDPDGFRLIKLSGSHKQAFHGVGPGLEIELDTRRAGPFMLAVYASGNAYAFLGDRDVEFSDANEFEETATWRFEKNEWALRGFVGLRFRWVPE